MNLHKMTSMRSF